MSHAIRFRPAAIVLALVLSGQAVLAQDPAADAAQLLIGRWSGSFRPGTMIGSMSGSNSGTGAPGRYSGSIEITPSQVSGPGVYRFDVRVSSNFSSSETLEWGVSNGRCGSKLIMLGGTVAMPQIEMRTGGSGEVSIESAMELNSKGQFQAVLFKGGHLQQNVAACANLRFDEKK